MVLNQLCRMYTRLTHTSCSPVETLEFVLKPEHFPVVNVGLCNYVDMCNLS